MCARLIAESTMLVRAASFSKIPSRGGAVHSGCSFTRTALLQGVSSEARSAAGKTRLPLVWVLGGAAEKGQLAIHMAQQPALLESSQSSWRLDHFRPLHIPQPSRRPSGELCTAFLSPLGIPSCFILSIPFSPPRFSSVLVQLHSGLCGLTPCCRPCAWQHWLWEPPK